jgi:hypothetical protein
MKYAIQLTILFLGINVTRCSDSTTIKENPEYSKVDSTTMFNHELSYYKNKPLETLLSESRIKLIKHVYMDEPPAVLNSVILVFENNHEIEVNFKALKYVDRFNIRNQWDFSLIQKETVSECEFVK